MKSPSEPKRQRATYAQQRELEAIILSHSTATADSQVRYWNYGWSFARAARTLGLSAHHAQHVAKALQLTVSPKPPPPDQAERLTLLEARLANVEAVITEIGSGLEGLYQQLHRQETTDAGETQER